MKVFIDDERYPITNDIVVIRTFDAFKKFVKENGCPVFISFDHDLGHDQPSGFDIAKWLIEEDLDNDIIPIGFEFDVHSQNPVGGENIRSLLNNYLDWKVSR